MLEQPIIAVIATVVIATMLSVTLATIEKGNDMWNKARNTLKDLLISKQDTEISLT